MLCFLANPTYSCLKHVLTIWAISKYMFNPNNFKQNMLAFSSIYGKSLSISNPRRWRKTEISRRPSWTYVKPPEKQTKAPVVCGKLALLARNSDCHSSWHEVSGEKFPNDLLGGLPWLDRIHWLNENPFKSQRRKTAVSMKSSKNDTIQKGNDRQCLQSH